MTNLQKQKVISNNAASWAVAALLSVILPFVTDSLTEGRSHFLRVAAQAAPLMVGMYLSSISLSKAIPASGSES